MKARIVMAAALLVLGVALSASGPARAGEVEGKFPPGPAAATP